MTSRSSGRTSGSDRRKADERAEPTTSRRRLNEYFIEGDGLNREVLQNEICRFLGPEATSRVAEHQGVRGYMIKAYRPFTSEMLKDLRDQSAIFEAEQAAHGRKPRASGREAMEYETSQTRRSYDPPDSRHGPPSGYPPSGTPYGQEMNPHGMLTGYGQPQQGYGVPPQGYGGEASPYAQQASYPPGYSMSQPPSGMTASVDQRYQPSDPRYGGQPPYGYGAAPSGGPPYYPQGQGYAHDTQMDMGGHNEPSRGHQYPYPTSGDRGGASGHRDHGGAMTGLVSPSGDPYGQTQPYQRAQQSPYDQPGNRGGYTSRQTEPYTSRRR